MAFIIHPFKYQYTNRTNKSLSLKETITIAKGTTVAIVGPSGSGKSSLLKLLKGIIPEYSSGTLEGTGISFHDKPLTGEHFKTNLNKLLYLFQNPFTQLIYPQVEEEFLFSMENFNFSKEEMEKQTAHLEKKFNLNSLWGKRTSDLSHGQCQRLVLSSLLAIGPEVLLLDEPTAFLDPEARVEFYAYLKELKKDKTIIVVDHHVNEIAPLVDLYLYVDENGEISLEKKEKTIESLFLEEAFQDYPVSRLKLNVQIKSFAYPKQQKLLENISFKVKSHEVLCIKGANGMGKSTLLKLITDIIPWKHKNIEVIGEKDHKLKKASDQIFNVYQNPEHHFYFDMIKEELEDSDKIQNENLKNKLLKAFFHNVDLEMSPYHLSEGEKRRLSLLMAILSGRKIIFYDEPTFGQDEQSIHYIVQIMNELKGLGFIQVMISHDEEFIKKVATQSYLLIEGRLAHASH